MKLPPFLLGSTLLFWGWQSQLLLFAVPMAVILECAHWIGWRWDLSDKDFNRVTDLTSLSLLIAAFYIIGLESIREWMTLLNWLPMLFFLLLVAQTYSIQGAIKLSSLFLSLRRYKTGKAHFKANQRVNITYPYLMVCLLSCSVSNDSWFFVGTCVLVAWGLWAARPQRYPIALFGVLLLIAGTLAYVGQLGIYRLHAQVEQIILNWFQDMLWASRDPYRQSTAIGDIGQLKLSDRILLRVDAPYPIRLREASYNVYFNQTWTAKKTSFKNVVPGGRDETIWTFRNEKNEKLNRNSSLKISAYLHKGRGMLALPHGAYQVSNLAVLKLQHNEFGAVKVEKGPGLIRYVTHFGQNTPLDTPPIDSDLSLPNNEKAHLTELSNHLNLPKQSPQEVLNTLTKFFEQNFQYSLKLTTHKNITPLENFLRHRRAGHCEYFATTTVLLLRTAGIPSRYAAGYAVEEFSNLENVYVVRRRHAHAWTLAYIDGRWQEFDTTPATWVNIEEEMAAWWGPIDDFWSFLTYQYSKWRYRSSETSNDWLIWLILPLTLVLIWRLSLRKKVERSQAVKRTNTQINSAFYQIMQHLNAIGYIRQPDETLKAWLKRIQMLDADMQTMLNLHQRYRFDPVSLNAQEQAILTAQVKTWLGGDKRQNDSI